MNKDAQELWNRIMQGQLDLDHPEVVAMSKRSEEFARNLGEVREVHADLASAGQEVNDFLDEVRESSGEDLDKSLLDLIPNTAAKEPADALSTIKDRKPLPPHALPSRWVGLVAAIVIAVFGAVWYMNTGDDTPTDPGTFMGQEGAPVPISPSGKNQTFTHFEWEGELGFNAWYVVHVVDLESGKTLKSPRLTKPQWTPTEPISFKAIRWQVGLHDGSGAPPLSSATVQASQ